MSSTPISGMRPSGIMRLDNGRRGRRRMDFPRVTPGAAESRVAADPACAPRVTPGAAESRVAADPACAPRVTRGAAGSRVLLHVPHAGTHVPAWVRVHLLPAD